MPRPAGRNVKFSVSSAAFERLAKVDTIVFDKTGTLTLPTMSVVNAGDVHPDLLQAASRLALSSHHPLASALARMAQDRRPYDDAIEESGRGVRAIVGRCASAVRCSATPKPSRTKQFHPIPSHP